MLDKMSEEYKAVTKLYKRGKITQEDYERLLEALENREQIEDEPACATEEQAERKVLGLLEELGIKIKKSAKCFWSKTKNAAKKVGDAFRNAYRHFSDKDEGNTQEDIEIDPCRFEEQYDIPYKKMMVRLNYIGKKQVEIITKTKKATALSKKGEKLMGTELSEKLNSLLAESFVGKYECSVDDEYMRLIVRPKAALYASV